MLIDPGECKMPGIDVNRIGTVHEAGDGQSFLEIEPTYRLGLDGLEPGHRIQVLYWMHELDNADRRSLRAHPRGDR